MRGIYWQTLTFKRCVTYLIKVNDTSNNYTLYKKKYMDIALVWCIYVHRCFQSYFSIVQTAKIKKMFHN